MTLLNFEIGIFDLREQWAGGLKNELASANHGTDEKHLLILSSTFTTARGRNEQLETNPPTKPFLPKSETFNRNIS